MRLGYALLLVPALASQTPLPPATTRPPEGSVAAPQPERMPTQEDFFREVLDPSPLPTSASFHDYSRDSYHADKIKIWQELPGFARSQGHTLRGLVIFGPSGPLWAYYVFALLQEGEQVRVNQVVFPHGRLTDKATGMLRADEAERWLAAWSSLPNVEATDPDPLALERRFYGADAEDFDVLVFAAGDPTRIFISGVAPAGTLPPPRPEVYAHVKTLALKLKPTYEHGDPVPSE